MKSDFKLILVILIFHSCTNEPVNIAKITAKEAIIVNSELYDNIERIADNDPEKNLVCIDFIYTFALNIFNTESEFIGIQFISNDHEFSEFLANLDFGFSISISYPIIIRTDEGITVEITDNDDLKGVIDDCLQKEIILNYNNQLAEEDCIWRVLHNTDGNNDFENSFFKTNSLGITSLFYNDEITFGTWIFFSAEDELHLNINLDNQDTIGGNWNFDWKATFINEYNLKLVSGEKTFTLLRECIEDETCAEFKFKECELEAGGGIAEFYLENYIECLTNFIEYEITENTIISFHNNLNDAENNINPLQTTPFTNTTNPQFINVRIENSLTGDVVYTSMELTAIQC